MPGTQPSRLIRLQPIDDVAIAATDIAAGSQVDAGDGPLTARDDIGRGHKIALRDLRSGVPVLRYGQVIGFAGRDIAAGEHVHLHNLEYREFQRDYEFAVDAASRSCSPSRSGPPSTATCAPTARSAPATTSAC